MVAQAVRLEQLLRGDEVSIMQDTHSPIIHLVDATQTIVALDLEGEFDIVTAPDLIDHAERALAAGKDLIINLTDATFIDSSILHALFDADTAAKAAGRGFVLQFGTHAAVERVLSVTGTDKKLATAPTRAQAIALIEQRHDPCSGSGGDARP